MRGYLIRRRENYLIEIQALEKKLARRMRSPSELQRCEERLERIKKDLLPAVSAAIASGQLRASPSAPAYFEQLKKPLFNAT